MSFFKNFFQPKKHTNQKVTISEPKRSHKNNTPEVKRQINNHQCNFDLLIKTPKTFDNINNFAKNKLLSSIIEKIKTAKTQCTPDSEQRKQIYDVYNKKLIELLSKQLSSAKDFVELFEKVSPWINQLTVYFLCDKDNKPFTNTVKQLLSNALLTHFQKSLKPLQLLSYLETLMVKDGIFRNKANGQEIKSFFSDSIIDENNFSVYTKLISIIATTKIQPSETIIRFIESKTYTKTSEEFQSNLTSIYEASIKQKGKSLEITNVCEEINNYLKNPAQSQWPIIKQYGNDRQKALYKFRYALQSSINQNEWVLWFGGTIESNLKEMLAQLSQKEICDELAEFFPYSAKKINETYNTSELLTELTALFTVDKKGNLTTFSADFLKGELTLTNITNNNKVYDANKIFNMIIFIKNCGKVDEIKEVLFIAKQLKTIYFYLGAQEKSAQEQLTYKNFYQLVINLYKRLVNNETLLLEDCKLLLHNQIYTYPENEVLTATKLSTLNESRGVYLQPAKFAHNCITVMKNNPQQANMLSTKIYDECNKITSDNPIILLHINTIKNNIINGDEITYEAVKHDNLTDFTATAEKIIQGSTMLLSILNITNLNAKISFADYILRCDYEIAKIAFVNDAKKIDNLVNIVNSASFSRFTKPQFKPLFAKSHSPEIDITCAAKFAIELSKLDKISTQQFATLKFIISKLKTSNLSLSNEQKKIFLQLPTIINKQPTTTKDFLLKESCEFITKLYNQKLELNESLIKSLIIDDYLNEMLKMYAKQNTSNIETFTKNSQLIKTLLKIYHVPYDDSNKIGSDLLDYVGKSELLNNIEILINRVYSQITSLYQQKKSNTHDALKSTYTPKCKRKLMITQALNTPIIGRTASGETKAKGKKDTGNSLNAAKKQDVLEKLKLINFLLTQNIKIKSFINMYENIDKFTLHAAKYLSLMAIEHAKSISKNDKFKSSIFTFIKNYLVDNNNHIIPKLDIVKIVYAMLKTIYHSLPNENSCKKAAKQLYDTVDVTIFKLALHNQQQANYGNFAKLCALHEHMQPENQQKLTKLINYDKAYRELEKTSLSNLKPAMNNMLENLYGNEPAIPNATPEKINKFILSLKNSLESKIDACDFDKNLPKCEESLTYLECLSQIVKKLPNNHPQYNEMKKLFGKLDTALYNVIEKSLSFRQEQSKTQIKKPIFKLKKRDNCLACLSFCNNFPVYKKPTMQEVTEQLPKNIEAYIDAIDKIRKHGEKDYKNLLQNENAVKVNLT